jgi:DNA-binding response OmpR family regulator
MAYVLIVDDDEDFALAVARVLGSAEHEVAIELDTDSGLKSMQARLPDLAILDVMFPEDSSAGFELARKMRHYSDELRDIPVLLLTAVNTQFPLGFSTRDIDADWMPVSDFLEKPVDFEVLCAKVSALLEQHASKKNTSREKS